MKVNLKPVVYISHPISENRDYWGPEACRIFDELYHSDEVVPICPGWSLYHEQNGPPMSWEEYLNYDLELIQNAVDAILMVPLGESRGREMEVSFAQSIGLPVFKYPEGLTALYEWAEARREDAIASSNQ